MLCFPRAKNGKAGWSRNALPPGGSIHKTSAPKSANTWLTCVPTCVGDRSITVSPSRAAAEATGGSGVMAGTTGWGCAVRWRNPVVR